ncbi:hypothetical protein D3C86_1449700 [compost metagenome]
MAAVDRPAVAWHCMWIGIDRLAFRRDTSSKATYGLRMPAMSLIATESAPMSSIRLARSTHISRVCTGLVV